MTKCRAIFQRPFAWVSTLSRERRLIEKDLAALEKVHDDMLLAEGRINLKQLDPREGLKRLIAFIWRCFQEHPEFISLVNAENMYGARHK